MSEASAAVIGAIAALAASAVRNASTLRAGRGVTVMGSENTVSLHALAGGRAISRETSGFASPPRDGFAFSALFQCWFDSVADSIGYRGAGDEICGRLS